MRLNKYTKRSCKGTLFLLFCDCAYDSVTYNLVKSRLSDHKQKWNNKPITMLVLGHRDWFILPLLLANLEQPGFH